jgi:hypothetical protein
VSGTEIKLEGVEYLTTKVVRTALPGAASIAGLLITTEAMSRREAQEGDAHARNAARRRDGLLIEIR